jgi:predicted glycosyltransferase
LLEKIYENLRENIFVCEPFCENICFPESFRENMFKKGANAQGSLKNFSKNFVIFMITERVRDLLDNFCESVNI